MHKYIALLLSSLLSLNWQLIQPTMPPQQLELTYISPAPGSQNISPFTSLAIRQGEVLSAANLEAKPFTVVGDQSSSHTGLTRLSDDRRTLLFYPDRPFAYGETVRVTVQPSLRTASGALLAGTSYQFTTLAKPIVRPDGIQGYDTGKFISENFEQVTQSFSFQTYPEFDNLMPITVTTPANGVGEGLVLFTSVGCCGRPYNPALFIVDDNGEPIFVKQIPMGVNVTDFKRQTVGGVPYLVYHVGTPVGVWTNGTYYVLDQSYTLVDSWTIGNGYGADEHELQLLENGNALLLSYTPIPYDFSLYGGPPDGTLIDIIIQEQDPSKNVIFEWHASDHIPITDTYMSLADPVVDYLHTNAIEVDLDDNLLISSRNTSEITKIDRATGDVIWRLGGKGNQFSFSNDEGFSNQHDIRRLANGHLTMFDNGNQKAPPYSRVVEYAIDEDTQAITRTWEYSTTPTTFAPYMGGMQRLENGNSIIGWGAVPRVTEVKPDGTKALELELGGLTYRAFRYAWDALPAAPPHLVIPPSGDPASATLYFAWNGATQIDSYEIWAGANTGSLSLVNTVPRAGFETSAILNDLSPNICVFQVKPVHHLGVSTPYSNYAYHLGNHECLALLPHLVYLPLIQNIP